MTAVLRMPLEEPAGTPAERKTALRALVGRMVRGLDTEEAEQELLGALMANNLAIDRVSEIVQPEHFYYPAHGRLYDVMLDLRARGSTVDPITLAAIADGDADLESVGGRVYIAKLAGSVVSVLSAPDYARTIVDTAKRRTALAMLGDALDAVGHPAPEARGTADEQIGGAIEALDRLVETDATDPGPQAVKDHAQEALREIVEPGRPAVATGLRALDDFIGGGLQQDLIIIGGRPGMGKTSLAETIAWRAARDGRRVGFFSLEMTRRKLFMRELAALTGIPIKRLLQRDLDKRRDIPRLVEATAQLEALPIHFDFRSGLTAAQIGNRARRIQRAGGLDLLVVDHIGLMGAPKGTRGRYEMITENINALQALGKAIGCTVLALVQLNREVEKREDKRPSLADLRDAGPIEEAARLVMFVYREAYYVERQRPSDTTSPDFDAWRARIAEVREKAEIVIAKNDSGEDGIVTLGFDGRRTRFHDAGAVLRDFDRDRQVEIL